MVKYIDIKSAHSEKSEEEIMTIVIEEVSQEIDKIVIRWTDKEVTYNKEKVK